MKCLLACCLFVLVPAASAHAAGSEVADAAMKGNRAAVRSLLADHADVNGRQVDGTTALHWAVRNDDVEMAEMLIRAGANASAANREGVRPMQLAALNGSAAIMDRLIKAGADPNAPLTRYADTALMLAARSGRIDALTVLLDGGANVNAIETWGGTTALMWAVSAHHPEAVKLLTARGADVDARSNFVPAINGRGFEGRTPVAAQPSQQLDDGALACRARRGSRIGQAAR
jgi:ankyrin repeat protein